MPKVKVNTTKIKYANTANPELSDIVKNTWSTSLKQGMNNKMATKAVRSNTRAYTRGQIRLARYAKANNPIFQKHKTLRLLGSQAISQLGAPLTALATNKVIANKNQHKDSRAAVQPQAVGNIQKGTLGRPDEDDTTKSSISGTNGLENGGFN